MLQQEEKKKRRKRVFDETDADFKVYIHKVLKQVHPECSLSKTGVRTVNAFIKDGKCMQVHLLLSCPVSRLGRCLGRPTSATTGCCLCGAVAAVYGRLVEEAKGLTQRTKRKTLTSRDFQTVRSHRSYPHQP